MKCSVNEDEPQTLIQFLWGLDSRIARVVDLHPYTNLEELINLAHKVEQQQRIKPKPESQRSFTRSINYPRTTTPNIEPNPPKTAPTNPLVPQRNAPSPSLPPPNQRFMKRCYGCQGVGHIVFECPNKKVITFVEYESIKEKEIECGETEEVECVGPNEGECLMIRKLLTSSFVTPQDNQRDAIFHAKCTIDDKVCSLIIDGGSCANVAS